MASYTPEFVAALRRRYEHTDQTMREIADEFGLGERTLGRMAKDEGWTGRGKRPPRELAAALRLLDQALVLEAEAPPTPDPSPPLAALAERGESVIAPSGLSPLDRLEALVVKEIEAEEAARAIPAVRPRASAAAERSARALAILTQTLQTLQRMRGGAANLKAVYDDDMPADIDEFRRDLARRIDAFVASRTDAGDAGGNSRPAALDEI